MGEEHKTKQSNDIFCTYVFVPLYTHDSGGQPRNPTTTHGPIFQTHDTFSCVVFDN